MNDTEVRDTEMTTAQPREDPSSDGGSFPGHGDDGMEDDTSATNFSQATSPADGTSVGISNDGDDQQDLVEPFTAGASAHRESDPIVSVPVVVHAVDHEGDDDDGSVVAAVVIDDNDAAQDAVVPEEVQAPASPPRKKRNMASSSTKKKQAKAKKANHEMESLQVSTDRLVAASDAREVIEQAIPRLPVLISDTHVVRSFGRLQLEHPSDHTKFSSASALYPVGFSCDRHEFSPVHGRVLKMRCTIFDGARVKSKQAQVDESIPDGPVFRVMWGQGVDDDADTVDYPYDPQIHSMYLSADEVDAVAVPVGAGRETDEIVPEEGMRVKVRFDHNEWYTGTIVDVDEAEWDSKKQTTMFDVRVQYDNGHAEDVAFPNPDISLHLPGSEDDANSNGIIELTEIRGKPVSSVIGASPLEAWGKALVHLGLIDEIMLKNSLSAVTSAREEGLAEAKEKLEAQKLQRQQARAKAQKQTGKNGEHSADQTDRLDSHIETPENGANRMASAPVDSEPRADGEGSEDAAANAHQTTSPAQTEDDSGDTLSLVDGQPTSMEPCTEEENHLRKKVESLRHQLRSAQTEDYDAQASLADRRIGALGPLLHNPFSDVDTSTLSGWMTSVVRKEKSKMGSTGNKKKIVSVTDLLERSNTFFNGDIEALVEGLPGSEFCQSYIFGALRVGGAAAISQAWVHEAKIRQERDRDRKRKSASAARAKASENHEKELKRKRREEERDHRKKQKLEEDEQKKQARADERLSRLNVQVADRLSTEATFQREKTVQLLGKNLMKEFARRRKAAELVAGQLEMDKSFENRGERHVRRDDRVPLFNRAYDEDIVRLWDFVSLFGHSFLEWGYLDSIPSLDSLQDAIDTIRGDAVDGITLSDARDLLVRISVALCQPLGASLTKLLFASLIALNPILQKDFGAAFFAEVNATTNTTNAKGGVHLPVNTVTWKEIARVTLLSDALIELGYTRTEASHVLRGYRSGGHPNSKEAKRLRRAEEFALSVLRQQIDQMDESLSDSGQTICIQVPSLPSSVPSEWTFFLHNFKTVPRSSISRSREQLRRAVDSLSPSRGSENELDTADLKQSLAIYDQIDASTEPAEMNGRLDEARSIALRVLDRATVEAHSSKSCGRVGRPDFISHTMENHRSGCGLRRRRIGHIKSIEMRGDEYKKLVHEKEEYMADALRLKEEVERKANPDDDEGSDDDEEENGRLNQETGEASAASVCEDGPTSTVDPVHQLDGPYVRLPSKETGQEEKKATDEISLCTSAVTSLDNGQPPAEALVHRVGKPTPYDEFCADVPSAPDLLRRCLAVLRTLCLSSPAEPFLYPVDPQMNPGYYESLLRPMCLREVGLRLTRAANQYSVADTMSCAPESELVERVVTQFGRDVRLIAKNCSGYANAGPAIIGAGEELLRIFERVFLDWVLAPEEVLPSLKRLDDDRCVEFHESDEDSMVLLCDGCEGKYNMSRLHPPLERVPRGDWYCPRCVNGHCWEDLDPRIGRRVDRKYVSSSGANGGTSPSTGVVARCMFRFPEGPEAKASLLYIVKFDDRSEEAWSLDDIDLALSAAGYGVPPIRCLEAVAESPGFGLGIDRGLYSDLVPVQLNPSVAETPSQAWLSSSVFRDTISSSITLLLLNPEEMTASEWLRLLVLLITKCSSTEIMQSLASKMENDAAEKKSKEAANHRKIQDVKDAIPLVSDGDESDKLDSDEAPVALAVNSFEPAEEGESMVKVQSSEIVEATEIEVVADVEEAAGCDAAPTEASPPDEQAIKLENPFSHKNFLIEEIKKRQKAREENIAAYCIKNQLRPIVASFEEDAVSCVVDSVFQTDDSGLSLGACRCRGVLCDFCGLSDTALGTPLFRVPNKKEWNDLMPHVSSARRCLLLADTGVAMSGVSKMAKTLVTVRVILDGELVSNRDDTIAFETHGLDAMTGFLPRNERGFQDELKFRHATGLPFVTGSLSAHECCAIAAHEARKDRVVQNHIEKEEALAERKAGMTCGRTLALGKDEVGRSYWKFNGSPSLFVCTDTNGPGGSGSLKTWYRYSMPEEIASLLFYLGHDEIVSELKRVFTLSSRMLRNRQWTDLLLKREFPNVFQNVQVLRESETDERTQTREGVMEDTTIQDPDDSEDEPYVEGERVLVESRNEKLLWDAVVVGVARSREDKVVGYRVKYQDWSSRFDEWVEPVRVVEPSENNLEVQEEMRGELVSVANRVPPPLETMAAREFLSAKGRLMEQSSMPDLIAVARVGPSASSEEKTFCLLKASLLMIEAALPFGAVDSSDSGPWRADRSSHWRTLVRNAPGPSSLMLYTILFEGSISPEYMDVQYMHLLSCMPLQWKAVKEVSVASLSLRILLIDRGLKYGA